MTDRSGKMRICEVIESAAGGSCRHMIDLCAGLARRGHDVHVIYSPLRADPRYVAELEALSVTLQTVDMHRSIGMHDLRSARDLARAILSAGPFDIVHGHSSKAGALIRLIPVAGARRVYTPHAFRGLDPSAKLVTRCVFDGAEVMLGYLRTDAVITVSHEELDFARRRHIAPGRCHVILNGVVDPVSADRREAREALGVPSDAVVIGFIGRLTAQKSPERFLEAMIRLLPMATSAYAVMMDDGENAGALDDLLKAPALRERLIRLRGLRASDYLPGFDMLMMTSRYEGLPYVMLESLAAGVPIVTTDVAGARDVIADTQCGVITSNGPGAVEELTAIVLELITNPGRRAEMAAQALYRSGQLNGPRMVSETEALYRSLCD
ncbi:glycosyltransferase involved in cell wall biosynthesis [Sphingomonas sp. SORGH_AS 950]|nr:glycosyltransferase involved in cell wall biosynthesis [Sphingomonas sp. SORGH_AS_0950]